MCSCFGEERRISFDCNLDFFLRRKKSRRRRRRRRVLSASLLEDSYIGGNEWFI